MNGGKITYHQQVSYCGKPRCRRCREGIGHGPYWYAYQTVNGRTIRTYVANIPLPRCKWPREKCESLCKSRNCLELWYASMRWGSSAWSTETSSNNGSRLLMPRCSTNASAPYCNASSAVPVGSWGASRPSKCSGQI